MKKKKTFKKVLMLIWALVGIWLMAVPVWAKEEEGFKVVEKNLETGEERIITIPDDYSSTAPIPSSAKAGLSNISKIVTRAQTRSVIGTDERQRVPAEEAYYTPFSAIGHLRYQKNKNDVYYGATAFMVGPDTAVSAAHCFYDKKGDARNITFTPGTNGLNAPYGMTSVKGFVYYPVQWIDSFDDEYDWAVFKTSSAIGNNCGWLGTMVTTDGNLAHQMSLIIGYPNEHWGANGYAEQWFGEKEMYAVTATKLFYDVDTSGGQSGSPIIQYQEDDIYVVGVHTYGVESTALFPQYNSGSRITTDFLNMIKYYLNQ